jgi:hypothetical protein
MCNLRCSVVVRRVSQVPTEASYLMKREVLMVFRRPYGLVLSVGIATNNSRSVNSHDERNQYGKSSELKRLGRRRHFLC